LPARNNQDRTSAPTDELPPTPAITKTPPDGGFSFVTPTEFVELPSGGAFYPEGHPLRGQETIEIRHMTAKDEDILTSRALLKKGIAIDRLLKSVITDSSINPDDLLIGDKNAVLIATRITGYGEAYNSKVTCIACGETFDHEFDLSEQKIVGFEEDVEGVKRTSEATFKIELPISKVTVEVKALVGHDEKRIAKSAELKKKKNLPETLLTDTFRSYIVSVNGDASKAAVGGFISSMPARDSKFLRNTYSKVIPNIDMTQGYECPECGYGEEVEIPLTAEFFWPK
tara:strand:- start:2082 stop:2936 length:855 start_codon:yes stop_codon:yes gene_type:complete